MNAPAAALLFVLLSAWQAAAAEQYAVVITGASGGDAYAQKYDGWRNSLVSILRDKFHYPDDRLFVLAEREEPRVATATREHVQRLFADLRGRLTKDDLLLVVLIGHGASLENDDGKFNLVGPDLKASEWADLVRSIPARLIFVNAASASFPFMHRLAAPGRIVVTATDAAAQQFETVFPEFFIKAFDDPAADVDKNGRVSIDEAFRYASAGVRKSYEQRGQLATERALVDDKGNGVGREADNPGADGGLAKATYLQPVAAPAADATLTELRKRQAELESAIDDLKTKRSSMTPEAYEKQLEALLLELARVSAQIRTKT